jgi:hypothetical protein
LEQLVTSKFVFALRVIPAFILALYLSACASSPMATPLAQNAGSGSTGAGSGSGSGGSGSGSAGSGSSTASSAPAPHAAYVYVSTTPQNGSVNQLQAFAAAANGSLTEVNGSPFQENVTTMAVGGNRLFAVDSDGFDIDSYSIAADGSIAHDATAHVSETGDCNSLGSLFVDRSGATLYALNFRGSGCANNNYESLAINSSTGVLTDLGGSAANDWLSLPASFLSNNAYAYSASCIGDMNWGIYAFQRGSSGLLTQVNANAAPPSPPSGSFYCPSFAAADGTGHIAIAMQPVTQQDFSARGSAQIAIYTAQSDGSLTTTSTAANMAQAQVGSVNDLKISPAGDLLAIAGAGGLQVFHLNGSGQATAYAGSLTSDAIDQCFWDNQGHLYAVGKTSGKLYVFTVTASSYAPAPGSPHAVGQPQNLAVDPLH